MPLNIVRRTKGLRLKFELKLRLDQGGGANLNILSVRNNSWENA